MAAYRVLSVQKGPLEGGGSYSSIWLEPLEYEDRAAPHLTRGPVPFKIDCSTAVVDELAKLAIPGVFNLDVGVKVGAGNRSKGYVHGVIGVAVAAAPAVAPAAAESAKSQFGVKAAV